MLQQLRVLLDVIPVPRAAQPALLDRALTERAALMRAPVLQRAQLPAAPRQRHRPAARRDTADPSLPGTSTGSTRCQLPASMRAAPPRSCSQPAVNHAVHGHSPGVTPFAQKLSADRVSRRSPANGTRCGMPSARHVARFGQFEQVGMPRCPADRQAAVRRQAGRRSALWIPRRCTGAVAAPLGWLLAVVNSGRLHAPLRLHGCCQSASIKIIAEVGCGDPPAGSTVRPRRSPGVRPDAVTGPVMPC